MYICEDISVLRIYIAVASPYPSGQCVTKVIDLVLHKLDESRRSMKTTMFVLKGEKLLYAKEE